MRSRTQTSLGHRRLRLSARPLSRRRLHQPTRSDSYAAYRMLRRLARSHRRVSSGDARLSALTTVSSAFRARAASWSRRTTRTGPVSSRSTVLARSTSGASNSGTGSRKIVDAHPWELVRGLVHSDGCRITNWTTRLVAGKRKRYEYPRYFFTNKSDDIRKIFTDALDRVGVEWSTLARGSDPLQHLRSPPCLRRVDGRARRAQVLSGARELLRAYGPSRRAALPACPY